MKPIRLSFNLPILWLGRWGVIGCPFLIFNQTQWISPARGRASLHAFGMPSGQRVYIRVYVVVVELDEVGVVYLVVSPLVILAA